MSVEFSVPEVSLVNRYDGQTTTGVEHKVSFSVQNRFESSRKVRVALSRTSHPDFHLLSETDEHYLAAGLKIPVTLHYSPQSAGMHVGEIEVHVNGQLTLTVPIQALPLSPCIEVASTRIDFGCLVNEHQISSQHLTVWNTGTKEAGFTLNTASLPPNFTVSTTEGSLGPGEAVNIIIELVCKQTGPFKEEISVVPSDPAASAPILVTLCGELVSRHLELLDPTSSCPLQRVSFGDAYYGSVVVRKALLYNHSPVSTQYMAVLDSSVPGSEAGVDMSQGLTMACTSGGLGQRAWKEQGSAPTEETIVLLNPSQGSLGPYQKCLMEFLFIPKFQASSTGWTHHQGLPVQRDYSLFVKFQLVGANTGQSSLEVALTGRACPVRLSLHPQDVINFGTCNTGCSSTVQLHVLNESSLLPLDYRCRGLPHYKCQPGVGRLVPGESSSLSVVFTPKQLGKLNSKLYIDVMVSKKEPSGKIKNGPIYTAVVSLKGIGGVSRAGKKEKKIKFADPNDLSTSVRPYDEKNTGVVITRYTKTRRYTYVDPDYCHTEEETAAQTRLKDTYTSLIKNRREQREWRYRERIHKLGAPVDMRMVPALGLSSPAMSTVNLINDRGSRGNSFTDGGESMRTTSDLNSMATQQLEFITQCPSKPANKEIAAQCGKSLSPAELSLIVIDPVVVDFGSVVVDSTAELNLSIKNYTHNHISIKMKFAESGVTCTHFVNKPTIQLIVPPLSHTALPLTMSQNQTGLVERSIEYSVNGENSGHLPVKAEVTQLYLTLSVHSLTLREPCLARQSAGFHGSVVVSNSHNIPAFFRWLAKDGVDTTIFNMLHPSGYVPANGSLECGFICQPSYESPHSAQFLLDDGRSLKDSKSNILSLVTEFKRPVCSVRERRLLFGTIPLNLSTTRYIHIDNTGDCHAYYKVVDTSPWPGLRVYPENGVVPRSGSAILSVLLCPQTVGNIDIRVTVAVREGKTLGCRLAGMVEQPILTVDKDLLRFGSVFCGAKATQNFTVTNKGSTCAELTFNLTHLSDFSLTLPSSDDPYSESLAKTDGAGTYSLKILGKSSAACKLEFCPKEVAAYDLFLPVLVNGLEAPTPPPSPWPPSQTASYIVQSQSTAPTLSSIAPTLPSFSVTPMRRVLATALRSPLTISNLQLHFDLPTSCPTPVKHNNVVTLRNVSSNTLSWAFGRGPELTHVEDGTFSFALPSGQPFQPPVVAVDSTVALKDDTGLQLGPGDLITFSVLCKSEHHGQFSASVPIIVNGSIYRILQLSADQPSSSITVVPGCIDILPVPLGVSLSAQFSILLHGFPKAIELDVAVPEMREGVCFSVWFPQGSKVKDCSQDEVELPCSLEFSSNHPVSLSDTIVFTERNTGKKKLLPFTVCADNSLFSVYKFLAQNIQLSTITLASNVPTLVLQSQSFDGSGRSDSVASVSSQGSVVRDTTLSLHTNTTFSDIFHQDCVSAVCRWLSAYGWSDGIKSITSPSDLRTRVGNDLPKPGVKQRSSIVTSRGLLVDMLSHLCGRVPPGIPLNLPPCTTASEKVNQQYSTLSTVIAFLKSQGALLWSIVPEALLDWADYQQWLSDVGGRGSLGFQPQGQEEFNELSTQAWTHLLMQIIKVLVLPRAVSQISKSLRDTVYISSMESNVYSRQERVLLAWLNHHYTLQRDKLFKDTVLSLTEVVNFDVDLMDCTVFACVLCSYCPFLAESHLSHFIAEPASPEQCTHNAIVLLQALRHIGVNYDLQASDLVSADSISLLLFTAFLCQRLPAFKSKSSTILFEGALNSIIRNQVNLRNPSTKELDYQILIRGDSNDDFTVQDNSNSITIGGKQSARLTVVYHSRCISPANATLLLVARGGRSVSGSTLTFRLEGRATSFKPQSIISVAACQYNCQSVSLKVTNTYKTVGEFKVQLCEIDGETLMASLSPKSRKRLSNSDISSSLPTSVLQLRSDDPMQLYHCELPHDKQCITLEPNETKLLQMKFVPLKQSTRHCFVVLSAPGVGDLVLSLTASVQAPQPTLPLSNQLCPSTMLNTDSKTLHLKVHAGQPLEEEIIIHSTNQAFENAVLEISKWGMSSTEFRCRQLTESLQYAALSTAIAALGLECETRTHHNDQSVDSEMLCFTVKGSDQEHFTLPHHINVPASSTGSTVLPVRFYSEEEGQFECHITLSSRHDVRVFVVETTVLATGRHAHLQFTTPAMQPITQDIPLVNPSTADWPLIASLVGRGFSGPESIVARALTTTNYSLTFNPHVAGTVQGELQLLNNSDSSEHVFQLSGMAEKPLAQDHITLSVQAKQSTTHILHVPNHIERTTVFRVKSDLDFVSGPSTITVGGGDVVDYCLTVNPKQQGRFSGTIAFITEAVSRPQSYSESLEVTSQQSSPYHVWFQLECLVKAAPPDHLLTLTTPTLSSSITQLIVGNTHPDSLRLQVLVEGHGLSGPTDLEIEPSGESSYPLTFAPTLYGRTEGRVVFTGNPDGEFWYKLILSAEDPEPILPPLIQCELGRMKLQTVLLRNPLDEPVHFTCDNANTQHFIVTGLPQGEVVVDPRSSTEVSVRFSPSTLGVSDHNTELAFISKQIGRQVFRLSGEGLPPTSMDPINISAPIDSNSVHIISFTNPFNLPTRFSVQLRGEDLDNFCLLLKRSSSILLHPGVSLDIPIMFAPEDMCQHHVTVALSTEWTHSREESQSLCWQYPIIGQPQSRPFSPASAPQISCSAKERLDKTLQVSLAGCTASIQIISNSSGSLESGTELRVDAEDSLDGDNVFTFKLLCMDSQFEELIEQCIGLKLLKQTKHEDKVCLEFGIVFAPSKSFSCICELQVTGAAGGVWLFPLHFNATTACPDDTITIEAKGLHKQSQIGFRLTSGTQHPEVFRAHLAPGSDPDLNVTPTSGTLSPVNTKGTLFYVTYKPTAYGRNHQAFLVVQSKTNEWRYKIVGQPPSYSRQPVAARVQKHNSPIRFSGPKKNFVSENIHKINVS